MYAAISCSLQLYRADQAKKKKSKFKLTTYAPLENNIYRELAIWITFQQNNNNNHNSNNNNKTQQKHD